MAGLFGLFHYFVDTALAERLMRVVWPLLWLIPAIVGAAAIAWRIAGRDAAVVTLLLAVVGLPAFQQFLPGRIDHHNVQIALSVATVAATVWSDRSRRAAWAAGALTGLALAIGLENLAFLALCGAAFALRYVAGRDGAGALARYGSALAASTVAAFFASRRARPLGSQRVRRPGDQLGGAGGRCRAPHGGCRTCGRERPQGDAARRRGGDRGRERAGVSS